MDDFYGWVKYDEMLKICDRYPYRVPIKGGFRQFTSECIIITSNSEPDQWYKFDAYNGGAALLRRIDINLIALEGGAISDGSEVRMLQRLRLKLEELGHEISSKCLFGAQSESTRRLKS